MRPGRHRQDAAGAARPGRRLADDFPDGAWLVELADLAEPDLVVSRVASVARASARSRPARWLDTLADALRSRQLLLVLDNCEHLIDACAQAGQRLLAGAPGLRVIATSREPLRVAASTVWQVPPLSVPPRRRGRTMAAARCVGYEAVRLFADRAAAVAPASP